jgi:hypothetical protein
MLFEGFFFVVVVSAARQTLTKVSASFSLISTLETKI